MSKYSYMTQGGYDKLVADLEYLKTKGRAEAAQAISEAREKGDLSENAEYDAAKDAQGLLEAKISVMDTVLIKARVLDQSELDTSKVVVFTTVTIKNIKNNREMKYQLVSETEANVKEKKISVTSPIGDGLLGKKIGEIADITTPNGVIQFEIMNIELL
jgi:transcription elongation factor GreA